MNLITGQSIWLAEPGLAHYPQLTENISCEVVIVGGGITGAFLGYYLTQAGLNTGVLEAREFGRGSTSASTAMCQYELDEDLCNLQRQVGLQRANDSYLGNRYAVHALGQLCQHELPDACDFAYCPSFYLATTPADVPHLREEGEARRAIGIDNTFLDEAELLTRFGLKAPAALLSDDTAQVNPFRLTQTLLQAASQQGLRAYERTPAQSYAPDANGPGLSLRAGDEGQYRVQARHLVMCTGYAASGLVPQNIVDLFSTYVVLSQPGQAAALPTGSAQFWEMARPYFYTRVTADGRIMIGGGDEPLLPSAAGKPDLAPQAEQLMARFQTMFAADTPFTRDYVWGGVYGRTVDSLPYIGPHPDFPRAQFALGYGGNGTTYSLLAAEIIRDALTGREHRYAHTFGFDRR